MILIGMLDSPFVRRVAISLDLLGYTYEHRSWSVGREFEKIREFSPLGRTPVLVLDDGEVLTESAMILDWLDDAVGADRALMPPPGKIRRDALRMMGFATGAVEKGLQQVMERAFRPPHMFHAPWVERCHAQMRGALGELEALCAAAGDREWLYTDTISQADITLGCFAHYLREAVPGALDGLPALDARAARYNALPEFQRRYFAFFVPAPKPAEAATA